MKIYSFFFLLTVVITSCSQKSTSASTTASDNKSFTKDLVTLGIGEIVEDNGLSIRFDEIINDSRCPKGGECIQDGFVVLKISSKNKDSDWKEMTLNTQKLKPIEFESMNVDLLRVTPDRKIGVEISGNDYQIKLKKTVVVAIGDK